MGGDVRVDSDINQGATFTVDVSAKAKLIENEENDKIDLEQINLISGQQDKLSSLQVPRMYENEICCLVANDDCFQMMAKVYNLQACGVKIIKQAINGLELYQSCNMHKNDIDFILSDLEMPIMNGYTACENIVKLYQNSRQQLYDSKDEDHVSQIISHIIKKPLMIACSGFVNESIRKKAL